MDKENNYIAFRCKGKGDNGDCNAFLFEYNPQVPTDVRIKCRRCGAISTLVRKLDKPDYKHL